MTDRTPEVAAARAKLDEAIRAYAVAAHDADGWLVTGWQVSIAAIHPEHTEEGHVGLLYETAPGQGVHVTLGLLSCTTDYYRGVGS